MKLIRWTRGHASILLIMLLAVLAASASCATRTRLSVFEDKLDTDSELKFEFHRIVDDPEGLGMRFPGFVFGFEKGPRKKIGCPPFEEGKLDGHIDLAHVEGAAPNTVRCKLAATLDDGKCMFLSHIVEYKSDERSHGIVHEFPLNLYREWHQAARKAGAEDKSETIDTRMGSAYEQSWRAIDDFGPMLLDRIQKSRATHVILYTFGWNSGQTEALRNVNSLHLRLLESLGPEVRPLPVLITWPSHWWDNAAGVFSYANKANDADELGAVMLNSLVHRTILAITQKTGTRTVAIGHSFGARAISRALCSESILVKPGTHASWDLFVGLQGAFSINRYLTWDDADEGTPCAAFEKSQGKVVLTWSAHDSANTVASWSRHAGGQRGYDTALEYGASPQGKARPVLDLLTMAADGSAPFAGAPNAARIDYVNASEVVRFENYVKSGGAHSDIYNEQIARFLATVIQRYAPSTAPSPPTSASAAPASTAPASTAPAPASNAPASNAPASNAPASNAPASNAPASNAPASPAPASPRTSTSG